MVGSQSVFMFIPKISSGGVLCRSSSSTPDVVNLFFIDLALCTGVSSFRNKLLNRLPKKICVPGITKSAFPPSCQTAWDDRKLFLAQIFYYTQTIVPNCADRMFVVVT